MKTLQLLRRSVKLISGSPSYAMDCEITASQNITKNVFVKLRMRNTDQTFRDQFYAVATPAQLEQLHELTPADGSVLFRINKMRLINTDLNRLEADFQSLLGELQQLCDFTEILDELQADGIYSITASTIQSTMAAVHIHYRIPLTAQPCGINEVFTDTSDNQQKHRITGTDTSRTGWLPTITDVDPAGTFFKYNLSTDVTISSIWPIKPSLISYAHVEINGITSTQVLINDTTVYWKTNRFGLVPWPKTFVSPNQLGDSGDAVTLVLDCIA